MVDGAERVRRIHEMQVMLESLSAWSDEMLRLDTDTLSRVLRLGAKIQKLVRGQGSEAEPAGEAAVKALGTLTGP